MPEKINDLINLIFGVEANRPVLTGVVEKVGVLVLLGVEHKLAVQFGLPERSPVEVVQKQLGLKISGEYE